MVYTRTLKPPETSFFLFGPRSTGKTTWLREAFPDALWFDLLDPALHLRLLREPAMFRAAVLARPEGDWVVVDEVQKAPAILDEVHRLTTSHPGYRFALSGSSARKLKRSGANMLAGRAINRRFFPLTGAEQDYKFDLGRLLAFGSLPRVCAEPGISADILEAYAANYVKHEIQEEALVQNLASFSRFLEIAAIMNGQVVSASGIARDAAVARPTVERYFEVLVDTLIGFWLPAWRPRAKVKETLRPKFYLFDPGVARALAGRVRAPLDSAERGQLLETLLLNELRAWMNVASTGGELSYWSVHSGAEVDFVWHRGSEAIGIEVKASSRWRREYGRPLESLIASGHLQSGFVVYCGEEVLTHNGVLSLPVVEFMERLNRGEIVPSPAS